ncbi:MAG TPA: endopeptidase La, partial [Clostridia bacterium]|nr:endopeptidase La [Clostridia bacterium]
EREIGILNIEQEISEKIHDQVDKNQREYYIREQIKVLSGELGEADNPQDEAIAYHKKIDGLKLKEEAAKRLHAEADRLMKMPSGSHEATVIRNWLDTCLSLPWNKSTKDKIDLGKARKVLDEDHYGLEKVKDRMIEFLAVKKLTSKLNGQIVCLVGPPGVGKTSIARSIAKAMGRHYIRVSLGGVRDEADIRGHRKTYIGAMPGRIIHALELAGTNNPLMLLDEVDKMSADFRGDPSSALLEVLDSEQNNSFRDHYVELPFDLSNVMFLTTANDLDSIPEPLLDRMEIITLSTYTREEKYHIALEHLLQKQLKKHGLNKRMLKIKEDSIYALIDFYTRESGVRNLERQIASICRKAAKQIAADGKHQVVVAAEDLEQLLGPKKYKQEPFSRTDEVGVVTGLAWTSVGGETMPIEVCVMEGSGKLELTGSLGDVMKESAKAAVSFIRSRAGKLMVDADFYKEKDIHIHVPEGAIPKDGPSAGVTMATALVSALSGRKVRHDVAMTGEITLSGRVLPIGGLREKTMAAYRDGIKTVIIPEENRPDLADVDSIVKEHIRFIPVSRVESVFETAIINPDEKKNDQVVGKATIINTIPVVDAQLPVIRQ